MESTPKVRMITAGDVYGLLRLPVAILNHQLGGAAGLARALELSIPGYVVMTGREQGSPEVTVDCISSIGYLRWGWEFEVVVECSEEHQAATFEELGRCVGAAGEGYTALTLPMIVRFAKEVKTFPLASNEWNLLEMADQRPPDTNVVIWIEILPDGPSTISLANYLHVQGTYMQVPRGSSLTLLLEPASQTRDEEDYLQGFCIW